MGIYQVVCSVFGVLITLTSSGLPMAVSKQTARLRSLNNADAAHRTVTAAAVIGVTISAIIALFIILFNDLFSLIFADSRCLPVFMVLLPGVGASAVYSAYRGGLWGQKNYFAFSLCEFLEQALLLGICVILVSRVNELIAGVYNAAVSITIAYTASALITLGIYFYFDGKIKNPRGYYKPVINSAAPITGIRTASGIISSLLAIIIPLRLKMCGMTNSQALSEFGIASGMTLPLLFIPCTLVGSLALAMFPEISGAKNKNSKQIAAQVNNSFLFALIVSCAMLSVYVAAGRDLGVFLFDNLRAGELLVYSAVVMLPMTLMHMSSSILNSLGREYKSLKNYMAGAAVMLVSVWFLPKYMGIYSMILGFFLSFFITACLNMASVKKDVKYASPLKNIPLFALITTASGLVCYIVNTLAKSVMPVLFSLALSGICSLAVFILLCAMFKIADIDTVIKKLFTKYLTKSKK